eukprot:scaffold150643_cov18-Tisochrysis_lutea.AAC.2
MDSVHKLQAWACPREVASSVLFQQANNELFTEKCVILVPSTVWCNPMRRKPPPPLPLPRHKEDA